MARFRTELRDDRALWLILARPEKHNAFDAELIADLTKALDDSASNKEIVSIVLAAQGKSFSAGADAEWMRQAAAQSYEQNLEDARALARLMSVLDRSPKTTIAAVQGPAYGGGVGLVACCDIAVASPEAKFSFSEVNLGLIPAVIAPYAIAAMGARAARRYFQTAELFDAETAKRYGLVHEIVPIEQLEAHAAGIAKRLATVAPGAKAAAKRHVRAVAGRPIDAVLIEETAKSIADVRSGAEAREGLAAFIERRKPRWP